MPVPPGGRPTDTDLFRSVDCHWQVQTSPATSSNRLRLLAPLGRGGMSDVGLAATRGPAGFEKLVAVKQLRLGDEEGDGERTSACLREARLAALLNHPNVVQTFEIVAQGGDYRIVMEFLQGRPLHQILRRGAADFQLAERISVLVDVLAGLHYVHELRDHAGHTRSAWSTAA